MSTKFLQILLIAMAATFAGCRNNSGEAHEGESHEGHSHEAEAKAQAGADAHAGHNHGEAPKFQYTAYSESHELFAEADAFVAGKKAAILAHFSILPDFKPVTEGKITAILTVNGQESRAELSAPTRKGIYLFEITPSTAGKGTLRFEISGRGVNAESGKGKKGESGKNGNFEVVVSEVTVFKDEHAPFHAKQPEPSAVNTTVFTKEQSWKIDFATAMPAMEPFGEVIKTSALVTSAQEGEAIVSAKSAGIVIFSAGTVTEGMSVSAGQTIASISGGMADNNPAIRFEESRNNYEKASADFERAKLLSADNIISQKEFLDAKNRHDNAKSVYENLKGNFSRSGQSVKSPLNGFIRELFVSNGAYVEAGTPLMVVSQSRKLTLTASLPQRYLPVLATVRDASIKANSQSPALSLGELKGKVLSYGKAANSDNFLIPFTMQIENNGSFIPGSFVEVYLKGLSATNVITVPVRALMEEQGLFYIWVQITPELFEKREVKVGRKDGRSAEILSGLQATERVVTAGAVQIKLAQATGTLDAHSGHVH